MTVEGTTKFISQNLSLHKYRYKHFCTYIEISPHMHYITQQMSRAIDISVHIIKLITNYKCIDI